MTTRVIFAIITSFVCATGAVADVIQPDATQCGEPNSIDIACGFRPTFLWPGSRGNTPLAFSWSASQSDATRFTLDQGSPVFDFTGSPVGTLTAAVTPDLPFGTVNRENEIDLVYALSSGGTAYRIDQPVEFVFSMGSDEFAGWKPDLNPQSADSESLTLYPTFERPWARELPEGTEWSELLSISLGGAVMGGLVALRDRLIPR